MSSEIDIAFQRACHQKPSTLEELIYFVGSAAASLELPLEETISGLQGFFSAISTWYEDDSAQSEELPNCRIYEIDEILVSTIENFQLPLTIAIKLASELSDKKIGLNCVLSLVYFYIEIADEGYRCFLEQERIVSEIRQAVAGFEQADVKYVEDLIEEKANELRQNNTLSKKSIELIIENLNEDLYSFLD